MEKAIDTTDTKVNKLVDRSSDKRPDTKGKPTKELKESKDKER